jgi:hypothetical protein
MRGGTTRDGCFFGGIVLPDDFRRVVEANVIASIIAKQVLRAAGDRGSADSVHLQLWALKVDSAYESALVLKSRSVRRGPGRDRLVPPEERSEGMLSVFFPLTKSVLMPLLVSASGWSGNGLGSKVSERVDLIEYNHFYDETGCHSFDQVIFYEWSPDYSRYHVIAWCLIENDPSRKPRRDADRGDYYVSWYDRDAKVQREVRAPLFRETWSTVDPERANKQLLEEKHRISLLRLTPKKR